MSFPPSEPDLFARPNPLEQLLTRFAGTRVLLVEDDDISQEVERAMLEALSFVVDSATNGRDALALASQRAYGLILMDLRLPGQDGYAVTAAIRAASLNRTTPILAVSGDAFPEDRERCRTAGMAGHLAKPLNPTTLHAALLDVLEHR